MTQTRLFMRVEVTMKREGMKTSTLVSGGSALPTGCRAVRQKGRPSSPSVPLFGCRTVMEVLGTGTAQPWCSAPWWIRQWMALSCHLLNTFYPIAHGIPTALQHQLGQEQCSPQCAWDGHGHPILPPAETPGSPRDASPPWGTRGMEQGERHRPNHLLIPTKASEKKDGQVRKPNTFFACYLPRTRICGAAQGAHPAHPPASPRSRTARGRGISFSQSHFRSVSVSRTKAASPLQLVSWQS